MKITTFIDVSTGGIADYAHAQASALVARGVDVEMLCPPEFTQGKEAAYRTITSMLDWRRNFGRGGVGQARRAWGLIGNFRKLAKHAAANPSDAILTHFSEHLAPLWAPRMNRLRERGTIFATVLHDPVRDYRVGPKFWHEKSVQDAFSILDLAFIHTLDPITIPGGATVKWIPHGVYDFPEPITSRETVRRKLGVPEDAMLTVAYGYLRDNKNLDLGIEAIACMPDIHLLVAGREQGGSNRPFSYYKHLAERLGCADRVHWLNRFISPEETADILSASDVLLLTYSRSFVSWSGVLSLAARYRLPAIVSGGTNTLGAMVEKFHTGVSVQPDSVVAIQHGLKAWKEYRGRQDWDGYLAKMSWDRNAELVEAYISELLNNR